MEAIPARLVLRPQIVIGGVHEKVRDGRLGDEAALRFALAGVDNLGDEIGGRQVCGTGRLVNTFRRTVAIGADVFCERSVEFHSRL